MQNTFVFSKDGITKLVVIRDLSPDEQDALVKANAFKLPEIKVDTLDGFRLIVHPKDRDSGELTYYPMGIIMPEPPAPPAICPAPDAEPEDEESISLTIQFSN